MKYFMDYVKASYEVILMGESRTGINLDHEIEAYVVHTYARYMEKPIAIQYMSSLNSTTETKKKLLEKVAEECLLINGLKLNKRRWPSETYFLDMGQLALETRAFTIRPPELFYEAIARQLPRISIVLDSVKNI
jgi:hypothetical protein